MAQQIYPWNYNQQFESYIAQFLRIFSGLQVRDGVERDGEYNFRKVPVYYGNATRIVSEILNKRSTFPNTTLPLMSGHLESLSIDTDRRGPGKYHKDNVSYKDAQGTFQTRERMIGPSLQMSMTMSIWASSNDEMFQILEQILLIFNPKVTIQKSDNIIDSNYITQVELNDINDQINRPLSSDSKIFQTELSFTSHARMNYPHLAGEGGVIEKIITNVYNDSFNPPDLLDSITVEEGSEQ